MKQYIQDVQNNQKKASSQYHPGDEHKCEISKDGPAFSSIHDMQTLFRTDFS